MRHTVGPFSLYKILFFFYYFYYFIIFILIFFFFIFIFLILHFAEPGFSGFIHQT